MSKQTNQNPSPALRPICFMIMPYGTKPTHSDKGPARIDFNALWDKALFPFIDQELGYHAVRADQDLGALIIKEMIERLALADLVIADVTIANANVYYEVGIRHTAKETGCVLVAADWSKQVFDIDQMRQVRYPMPEGTVTDETAAAIIEALKKGVKPLMEGTSPVYDSLPGFPKPDLSRAGSFRKQVEELTGFSIAARSVRLQPRDQRAAAITTLATQYKNVAATMPSIAMEIIYLWRDSAQWQEMLDFIDTLPDKMRNLPVVKEQHSLARSKTGDHLQAIAALEELISLGGDSSERRGLLGGRYKKLYAQTKEPQYLSKAIAEYEKGMQLDLNDYYPTCNLPRLLRTRDRKGDEEKARAAATVTLLACERARHLNAADPWLLPTLLAAAFDAGDVATAEKLHQEILDQGAQPFHLDTTVADLETALQLLKDEEARTQLQNILDDIKQLA